jgi:transcriptional regulator with XRE-family HTH domain
MVGGLSVGAGDSSLLDGSGLTRGDREAALAISYARRMRPPMKAFAFELRAKVGRVSLSRQAIYRWESGEVPVPASVLLAAARITGLSVEELVRLSAREASIAEPRRLVATTLSTHT